MEITTNLELSQEPEKHNVRNYFKKKILDKSKFRAGTSKAAKSSGYKKAKVGHGCY